MTSIFGLPLELLDNLTSAENLDDATDSEKTIFVGGLYNELHDNIFLLFGQTPTAETQHVLILSSLYKLVSLLPCIIAILCQVGFALIQSGASKFESAGLPFFVNSITFVLTAIAYYVLGYALSHTDGNTVLGYDYWLSGELDPHMKHNWLMGFALALTTTNIATCGGLERGTLLTYVILSPVLSGLVHGIATHWTWHVDGWLLEFAPFSSVKYQDFGGSGLVHVVGGASSIVLSVVLGPRYNRIREQNSNILYNDLEGHSLPNCINCDVAEEVGTALVNIILAAGTSCLFTVLIVLAFTKYCDNRKVHWPASRVVINGLHVGMVAVAAGCNVYPIWSAIVVGLTSAVGYVMWSIFLYKSKTDDPLGVAAVHLGGGIWGLICVGLFENETGLVFGKNMMLSLTGILWNFIGALALGALSGCVTGIVLAMPRMASLIPLPHVQEIRGLDVVCIQQEAYSSGNKVTHFNTDHIEDRERYGDESPGSTALTSLTSPLSYNLTNAQQVVDDIPYLTELSYNCNPQIVYSPSLSHHRSPRSDATDRRVWFSNSPLMDHVTPESPLIDYHKHNYIDIDL